MVMRYILHLGKMVTSTLIDGLRCSCISFSFSNEEKLHYGTIICSLGVRYKFYCSNIVRTMLYEPSQVSLEVAIRLPSPLSYLVSYCKIKGVDANCELFLAAAFQQSWDLP